MKKRTKRFAYAVGIAALIYRYNKLNTTRYTIKSNKLKDPARLVLLADLHSVSYGDGQEQLVRRINTQKPDFVVFSGDIVDDRFDQQRSYLLLERLAQLYPCYFATGNHEYKAGHTNEIKRRVASLGVHVLDGKRAHLPCGADIFGIDDMMCGKEEFRRQLSAISRHADRSVYNIVIQHQPNLMCSFSKSKFDLMLSGHTHGGQVVFPGLVEGLYVSGQGLFPKYTAGEYKFGKKRLIVSRGLTRNTRGFPRLFNRPELVVVDLIPEKQLQT